MNSPSATSPHQASSKEKRMSKAHPSSNPFKALRQSIGLSQYAFAVRIGVSKHAILRLEQGCYSDPLPSVVTYCVNELGEDRRALLADYSAFQKGVRQSHPLVFGAMPIGNDDAWPVGMHPLTYLHCEAHLNLTQVAKKLAVSQTVLHYFVRNPAHQQTIPDVLETALRDNGYLPFELVTFNSAYQTFRNWLIKEQRAVGVFEKAGSENGL